MELAGPLRLVTNAKVVAEPDAIEDAFALATFNRRFRGPVQLKSYTTLT